MRLGSGNFQDLSVLTMNYSTLPQSPMNTHNSLSRRSSHSSVNVPSNRLRNMSDTHSSSALLRSACPDMDSDELNITAESSGAGSRLGSERVHSLVYHQYHPSYDFSTFPSSPSTGPGNGPEEVVPVSVLVPHQDCIPVDSIESGNGRTDGKKWRWLRPRSGESFACSIDDLVEVTTFHDFLFAATCNCHDVNPNAPANARLCYDYLNTGKCKRDMAGEILSFSSFATKSYCSVVDKIRNGKMPVCLIRQCG